MALSRRTFAALAGTALFAPLSGRRARAEGTPIRIGVLTDMSSAYSDISGRGSVAAAQLAIEDFGGQALGMPVELISADHQNKPDVGAAIAREWYDRGGVDLITDLTGSAIAMAVQVLAQERNKVAITTGSVSTDISGKSCSPNGFQWAEDSYSLTRALGVDAIASGASSWYLLSPDAASGKAYEKEIGLFLSEQNVPLLGTSRFPVGSSDFSAQLLAARASGAKAVVSPSGGMDTINLVKQASEFGIIQGGQKLVLFGFFPTDAHALGVQVAQGIRYTTTFYWDLNDQTRSFQSRFISVVKRTPTWIQAGTYSAVTHYLRAVQQAGARDGTLVLQAMRALPVQDATTPHGTVRPDGRVMRDVYAVVVKSPGECRGEWDFEGLVRVIPAEQSFRPLAQSECPLVRKI